MSSRMRWRSSRLMFCALSLPSCFFPCWAKAPPAARARTRQRSKLFMAGEMLRGLAREGVSPLPKFVTMYCPMPELKTRILVVDDDQRLRDLLVRYLGGEGYEVKAVPDAPGMDKQLARERYDLVVLDLMLPGEDGLAICRRLRAQNSAPAITCPSHSTRASCSPASMPCCGGAPPWGRPARRPRAPRPTASAASSSASPPAP